MKLHGDNEAFTELVEVAAEAMSLPQVYIEKDYWVTKALKHLSESAYINKAVFKGGTSLSKAYRLISRFSEDIDLAILPDINGDVGGKGMLKHIEKTITQGLSCLKGDERESKGSKYRKTVYQYPRSIEGADFGQASPELLVEINTFTHPEPFETRELQTFIAEVLTNQEEEGLIKKFGLESFSINVLSVKRTLVEKMLRVIKDSYHDAPVAKLSDRIRHLYDICLILREEEYRSFIQRDEFATLCSQCIADEKAGVFEYSDCFDNPLYEAPIFSNFENWKVSLEKIYRDVFQKFVYGILPDFNEIISAFNLLRDALKNADSKVL